VDRSRSRDPGGTGLGLSIVRHLVELHGGHVAVANRTGGGAIFTVRLPAS
jgi:signal transduction histidine kinase